MAFEPADLTRTVRSAGEVDGVGGVALVDRLPSERYRDRPLVRGELELVVDSWGFELGIDVQGVHGCAFFVRVGGWWGVVTGSQLVQMPVAIRTGSPARLRKQMTHSR